MRNYGQIAKDYGYHVSVIDLRNPTRSNGNNLLHLVNKYMDLYQAHPDQLVYKARCEKYAKIISKTIILSGMDAASFGQNAYFYDAAEGLLTATILLVAEFCESKKRHIVSVFKIIQELLAPSGKKGKNQFQQLMELLPNDHKAKWFAGSALNTAEQSMASVMSTALSRLNAFLDSELEQILCFDMEFKDVLNRYMERTGCSARDLAERSGLSTATISRYRTGDRVPEADSRQVENLAKGIAAIAAEKKIREMEEEAVRQALSEQAQGPGIEIEKLRLNFDTLLKTLSVSVSDLARFLSYDPSYLSRIRKGQRKLSDPQKFTADVSQFIARRYQAPQEREALAALLECPVEHLSEERNCIQAVAEWMVNGVKMNVDAASSFLQKLDEFNLDEYIRIIHFDELKVPTFPFQLPTSKYYTGLKQMIDAELDFLKATVLSKSMEPVTMYSDMPMEEMAKDPEFPKKWMFGMAMMLKKGLHLNQIHCLDRSFEDMMLGLESWIPMYMTGQISPYYLKGIKNCPFSHFLKVSGTVALSGEAIAGYHSEGRYYLTKNREEVGYYKKRAKRLLSRAMPLMDIYRQDASADYHAFLKLDAKTEGTKRSILSSLPLYTADDALIFQILRDNRVSEENQIRIMEHIAFQRELTEEILSHDSIFEAYPNFLKKEFAQYPMTLSLAGAFYEEDIVYTYEQYREHLEMMKRFSQMHKNYHIEENKSPAFRHIQILIHEGSWAIVSKEKTPAIHFVIRHPKMREAMENITMPIVEGEEYK